MSYRRFSGGQGVWSAKREKNDGDMVAIGLLALNSNRWAVRVVLQDVPSLVSKANRESAPRKRGVCCNTLRIITYLIRDKLPQLYRRD